jgi:AMMECR1 domain-containing protein
MPEFPVRHGLSKQQALEEACMHAKLPESYWKQPSVEVFYFTSQRFVEETPSGKVNEMVMNKLPVPRRGAANS